MKRFTLFLTAVVTVLAMAASPMQGMQRHVAAKPEMNQSAIKKVPAAKMLKMAKASESDDVIWDQPEGRHQYYFQWGNGYTLYDGTDLFAFEVETSGQMVWADNNEVYITNSISSLRCTGSGWVKGTVSDDGKKITVNYPQKVNYLEGYDAKGKFVRYPLYVSVMKYNEDTQDYSPVADEDNVVTYTIGDDGKIMMDGSKEFEWKVDPETEEEYIASPDTMLSCYYEYVDEKSGETLPYWFGYADIAQMFTPLPDGLIINEIPDGLTFELWGLTDVWGVEQSVDVAIAGNNVYIKDIDAFTADCVVKGTIEGDKVTFPSKQFFGIHEEYGDYMFFVACGYGMVWYEEFQDYYEGYYIIDELVMDYNAATKTLTAPENTGFMMNAAIDRLYYYSAFLEPVIVGQDSESLIGAPADPEFMIYERRDDLGQDNFMWIFPNQNVNGAFIDTKCMYYNVYVDGELYTFTPDEYPYVLEAITDLPYDYCDDNCFDIVANAQEHTFYIYGVMETFGIIMYYKAPDGNLYSSQRVTYNILNDTIEYDGAIDTVSDAEPIGMEFYNLQGMKVAAPTAGNIYIRTITFKDGSKKSSKFIAR